MNLLLDTHTLFWWQIKSGQLAQNAADAIKDRNNEVVVSVVTAWEIAIKVGLGKWPEAEDLIKDFEGILQRAQFSLLLPSVTHVRQAGLMVANHRDPFDRLLAAQASIEGLSLVTADARLAALGAPVLW